MAHRSHDLWKGCLRKLAKAKERTDTVLVVVEKFDCLHVNGKIERPWCRVLEAECAGCESQQ